MDVTPKYLDTNVESSIFEGSLPNQTTNRPTLSDIKVSNNLNEVKKSPGFDRMINKV